MDNTLESLHELMKNRGLNFVSVPGMESEFEYSQHHLGKYLEVKKIFDRIKPKKVLDIGIGTGAFYSLFPDISNYEIHGLEYLSQFIPILEKRGIRAQQCDIEKDDFPFDSQTFDMVICDSVIEHTLKPKHLLFEVQRVLKSKGSFVMVLPNATSIIRRWNHLRGRNIFEPLIDNLYSRDYLARCSVFYSERDLRKLLTDNSLKISDVMYLNETSNDRGLITSLFRLLSKFVPQFRDVILITGNKD